MVCAALIDSGKPARPLKNTRGINAIVSGGRLFFAVIQGADGGKLQRAHACAFAPFGRTVGSNFRPRFQERDQT
jgi:hypothetical protein